MTAKKKRYEHRIAEFDAMIVGSEDGVRGYLHVVCQMAEELKSRAKQIHDMNVRVTYSQTAAERIAGLESQLALEADRRTAQEQRHREETAKYTKEALGLADKASAYRDEAANLRSRIEELEQADGNTLDVDAEVNALTEVIRAAKAIRRRWRGDDA